MGVAVSERALVFTVALLKIMLGADHGCEFGTFVRQLIIFQRDYGHNSVTLGLGRC